MVFMRTASLNPNNDPVTKHPSALRSFVKLDCVSPGSKYSSLRIRRLKAIMVGYLCGWILMAEILFETHLRLQRMKYQ